MAATNAVLGLTMPLGDRVNTSASFTEPEYAQTGLTEAKAREPHDIVTDIVRFDSTTRTIIDGHTFGFCKLITDRKTSRILGCHIVGERAVEIAQVAAIAIATHKPAMHEVNLLRSLLLEPIAVRLHDLSLPFPARKS
jgi:pyruvate/2-oxoglutarate dehydrogenase complex dihydrolipoamide dehydrogenase (E3) component